MQRIALLSVYDKTRIVQFAIELKKLNYLILATGNTSKLLIQNNIECTEISDYTSSPEIFNGRVKTLHPKIFGGILMRQDNQSDRRQAEENNLYPIDVVCVNLYPFPQIVKQENLSLEEKIENIDIGGPSLIRASAKNYKHVSVLTNPDQYDFFIKELKTGSISELTRQKLAFDAFAYTSYYDTLITNFFEKEFNLEKSGLRINYLSSQELRYGENPHQKAVLFGDCNQKFEILHGKELSYNNILDLTASIELISDIEDTACCIIKHTNPCGAAIGKDVCESYEKALSCDPVSAFGGIVVFNKEVDEKTASKLNDIFLEIVCAPKYSEKALELLSSKKNRRLIKIKSYQDKNGLLVKSVLGGILAQTKDSSNFDENTLSLVTKKEYTETELEDLKFAWIVCKHTKSNAIVLAKNRKIIGVGAGQMSRVDSVKIAITKAKQFGHDLKNAVAASDAFFPFADGVLELAEQGITSIVQPGGSIRDEEVINAANEKNISMIFTGIRNFKH